MPVKEFTMFIVKLPGAFRGSRYGLDFDDGEATTYNAWLARHLTTMGIVVEETDVLAKAAVAGMPCAGPAEEKTEEKTEGSHMAAVARDPDAEAPGTDGLYAAAGDTGALGEIDALRDEATRLGVTFAHNSKAETIRRKIEEAKAANGDEATA